jgi:predicted GNAT family acetyltransferase
VGTARSSSEPAWCKSGAALSRATTSVKAESVAESIEVRVVDNQTAHRYEAFVAEDLGGFAEYTRKPGRTVFTHTSVEPAFEGKGVGGRLAAAALDDVRARGESVVARCPFIAEYIDRHPAYADLVVPDRS